MSQIVESLDRLQKQQKTNLKSEPSEEIAGKDSIFSKLGILLWLGASISATVFSYHLGVNQGLQAAKAESPKEWLQYFSDFAPSAQKKAVPLPKVEPMIPAAKQTETRPQQAPEIKTKPAEVIKKQGFTIQVITYMNEKLAKDEVERLAKKGQKAFVLPSGKYFQVCLELFDNKKLAARKLTQLRTDNFYKTAYPGAYIKFLKK